MIRSPTSSQPTKGLSKKQARERASDLLDIVRIEPARLKAYPHQLSGGMRQRVVIAMAVALRPTLLIMDEPTTALDVVVQQEIMAQIAELQRELGFSVLFITHDISLMIELSHRMAVMYAGRFVETAPSGAMFADPRHPYTKALINAFPRSTARTCRCSDSARVCVSPTSPTCARKHPATGLPPSAATAHRPRHRHQRRSAMTASP